MEKAYDLAVLGEMLKKEGLAGGEVAAAATYKALKKWFADSAAKSSTPFDDLVVAVLPQVDAVVLPQIDKISPDVVTEG
jgi:hypothetical protein